jgi:hypothetical protein
MAIYNVSVKDGHLAKNYNTFFGYNLLARTIAPPCGCCEGLAKTFAISWDIDYSNAPCASDFTNLSGSIVVSHYSGPTPPGTCTFSVIGWDPVSVGLVYSPVEHHWRTAVHVRDRRTSGVCQQGIYSTRDAWMVAGRMPINEFQCDGVNVFNIHHGMYYCPAINTMGQLDCLRFDITPAAGTIIVSGL